MPSCHISLLDAVKSLLDLDPLGEWATVGLVVAGDTVGQETTIGAHLRVVGDVPLGEAPLARDGNLLATGELELGTTEGLDHVLLVLLLRSHRDDHLTDVDTGDGTQRLTKSATHSGLKSISTGTRQHLVDTQHMERVHSNANVERVLATSFHLRKKEDISTHLHLITTRKG